MNERTLLIFTPKSDHSLTIGNMARISRQHWRDVTDDEACATVVCLECPDKFGYPRPTHPRLFDCSESARIFVNLFCNSDRFCIFQFLTYQEGWDYVNELKKREMVIIPFASLN